MLLLVFSLCIYLFIFFFSPPYSCTNCMPLSALFIFFFPAFFFLGGGCFSFYCCFYRCNVTTSVSKRYGYIRTCGALGSIVVGGARCVTFFFFSGLPPLHLYSLVYVTFFFFFHFDASCLFWSFPSPCFLNLHVNTCSSLASSLHDN